MIFPPPEVKNLSICLCLWVKSLAAKWIILQLLLQETDIILRLFSISLYYKSPNLFHTAVKKIIITIFNSFGDPHNPITFLPPNRLCSFAFPLSFPPPLRHNTHGGKPSSAHTYTHTYIFWGLCWGLSVWHRALWLCILCAPVRGEEIRGQQTTAKPDTTPPTWGGSGGVEGVKVSSLNLFVSEPLGNVFFNLYL